MNKEKDGKDANKPVDSKQLDHLIAAAEATFGNAEDVYNEALVLAKAGHHVRAVFLHQISLEECGKLEMLGGWIVGVIGGLQRDAAAFYRALSQHKAKNSVNSYMLEVEGDEFAAQERGDWKGKGEAFKKMQQAFHQGSNRAKNASLYVDVSEGKIDTPKASVTEEMLADFRERNDRFLSLMRARLEMIQSWSKRAPQMEASVQAFMKEMEQLGGKTPDNLEKLTEIVIEQMKKALVSSNDPK